jgi:hypothetical protein
VFRVILTFFTLAQQEVEFGKLKMEVKHMKTFLMDSLVEVLEQLP